MNRKLLHSLISLLVPLLVAAVLSACSTKKNTATSRAYQAFTTRYNVYFNGDEHYKEQIKTLENDYADDYTGFLLTHPAEAYADKHLPQPSTNFKRTIEKMQKAIQLHSIKKRPAKNSGKMKNPEYRQYLKREEYNPFLHNAWFLMAKAQYMDGDFLDAAATFHYITRHFQWLPDLVAESQIWEARCYIAEGWMNEAEEILRRIKPAELKTKNSLTLYNLASAAYYVKTKDYKAAAPYLAVAAKNASGGQKTRLYFLLGQVYSATGERRLAYEAFGKAGSNPNSTYRTKLNARIRQSEVSEGKDVRKEISALKRMTRYDRNADYLDQIYYAIGNLYLAQGDTTNAISNYTLAAQKSKRNGIEKAIAQVTLGTIYFDRHDYIMAQPCYAEGVSQLSPEYPNYELLKRRSDVLDELALYAQNVKLNDSLLVLAAMPLEEQKKVAQRLVDELKEKERKAAEEAMREEQKANQQSQGNLLGNSSVQRPANFNLNNDKSWYFYNPMSVSAGKTEFQKLWGNRKLEDNWRRRNKTSYTAEDIDLGDNRTDNSTPDDSTSTSSDKKLQADDPHNIEYYLKQIPKTPAEIQNCKDIIMEGYYNMGLILKDKLEDFPAAIAEWDILLKQFPDNPYRLDVYYNIYLIYARENNKSGIERYRQLIVNEFPESNYGLALRNPDYLENLRNMENFQEQEYEKAYTAYLDNRNNEVHQAYSMMMEKYPLSKLMPKFMFIDALSYLTDKNYTKFREVLKEMLERYPETDITPTASDIMRQIVSGRKLEGGSTNVRPMIWDMRLSNDSVAATDNQEVTPFDSNQDTPQYYVMVFNADSINSKQLLFDIARHNFNSFVVRDFDLEPLNFGALGMIVIKGFANFNELNHYKKVLQADREFKLPEGVTPVMISEKNFQILLNEGRSFEDYFRFIEEEKESQAEKSAGISE